VYLASARIAPPRNAQDRIAPRPIVIPSEARIFFFLPTQQTIPTTDPNWVPVLDQGCSARPRFDLFFAHHRCPHI
jgi:hypothetical protein